MKKLFYVLFVLVFVLKLSVLATDNNSASMGAAVPTAAPYFDPSTINVRAVLPDPPADGSDTTKREIKLILLKQAARTPEEVTRIKQEVHLNVWLFKDVLGPWYTKENLPITTKLFARVDADEYPIIMSAKKYWNRPRPSQQDNRVHPPIDLPNNASYPSGHACFSTLTALILAELVADPDLKVAVLLRGQQIGQDRVIAGVHFPSDVQAGGMLAKAIFGKLVASPDFLADVAKAKTEIARAQAAH